MRTPALHLHHSCVNSYKAFRNKILFAENSFRRFKHLLNHLNSSLLMLQMVFFKMEFSMCLMTLHSGSDSSTCITIIPTQDIMVVTRPTSCSSTSSSGMACSKTLPTMLQLAHTANSLRFPTTNHMVRWDAFLFQMIHESLCQWTSSLACHHQFLMDMSVLQSSLW